MGTTSLERIIQDVDLALKALEISLRENGTVKWDKNQFKKYKSGFKTYFNLRTLTSCLSPELLAVKIRQGLVTRRPVLGRLAVRMA